MLGAFIITNKKYYKYLEIKAIITDGKWEKKNAGLMATSDGVK